MKASVLHSDETIQELRANRQFAVEYLKALLAVLKSVGMRLSVQPDGHMHA